jgi:hypothetical protein
MRTTSRVWRQGGNDFTLCMIPTNYTTLQTRHSHQKNKLPIDKTLQMSVSNRLQCSNPPSMQPRFLGRSLPDSQGFSYIGSKHHRRRSKDPASFPPVCFETFPPLCPEVATLCQGHQIVICSNTSMAWRAATVLNVAQYMSQRGRIAGKGNKRYSALKN